MPLLWRHIEGSEAVEDIGYDPEREELHVVFTGGREYAYRRVPPPEVAQLLTAPSVGTYVNLVIKPKYDYEEVRRH